MTTDHTCDWTCTPGSVTNPAYHQPTPTCDCKRRGEHPMGSEPTCAFHGQPVTPAITRRHLSLISEAQQTLTQLKYEGSHTVRQDPAPTHGSPWESPDLPAEVRLAVDTAIAALGWLEDAARKAATADPDRARR